MKLLKTFFTSVIIKCCLMVAGMLPGTTGLQAQNTHTIAGRITDSTGVPLQGASIVVEGTKIGTTTDKDGNYSIHVSDQLKSKRLVFSFTNYITQQVLGIKS